MSYICIVEGQKDCHFAVIIFSDHLTIFSISIYSLGKCNPKCVNGKCVKKHCECQPGWSGFTCDISK